MSTWAIEFRLKFLSLLPDVTYYPMCSTQPLCFGEPIILLDPLWDAKPPLNEYMTN